MLGYSLDEFRGTAVSVAMTDDIDQALVAHLLKQAGQEDLAFAYWRPSHGATRYSCILHAVALPGPQDRSLHGNVSFSGDYLLRVLADVPAGSGVALLHSHLGPGWQGMSHDDEVAERDRLGSAVAARTGLPVLGLTLGTDGTWSARVWVREGPNRFTRLEASTVRVVGRSLRTSHHPRLQPVPAEPAAQAATISVWGRDAQADMARVRVGIVGLGSVGSLVAEGLSRLGVQHLTYIDYDTIEVRNLDRTLHATTEDAERGTPKVEVARRGSVTSHTASSLETTVVHASLVGSEGLRAALDCDVLLSCVDRPLPRAVLNAVAVSHLIPVIDGGILAAVNDRGTPQHVDWRIHTVGPGRRCLYCLGAVIRSDVSLEREGKLDDPDYMRGLSPAERERYARRNVFPFSMSVAAHQLLQLVGLVSGMSRVGGVGPQHYSAYPGV